ncbi:hypothetical protein CR203_20775 [Salipaludibacillus neizhouensis]|uniref:Cxxc_20_cxxc protein n=1 Tax=Salipaludibacillus neizhouensis TaxID=885475 RepID=A0A3A9KD85_9BACI|nr:TIGR04104 family putative zinc finger protein [Salipaludibacillus neizhouensis]RKL65385.1 hypothetical protein CR203_20775 [Salipaludibacillus neizhouensis]
MKLPTCWSCSYGFKWSELLIVMDGRKQCPHCSSKQYFTAHSIFKSSVVAVPLVFIPFILKLLNTSWTMMIFIAFLLLMIYIVCLPFLYEFTNEQQHFFK